MWPVDCGVVVGEDGGLCDGSEPLRGILMIHCGGNDERRVHAERARLLDVLHGEAAHLVVVSHLAPGAADRDDLLENIKQCAAAGACERA